MGDSEKKIFFFKARAYAFGMDIHFLSYLTNLDFSKKKVDNFVAKKGFIFGKKKQFFFKKNF